MNKEVCVYLGPQLAKYNFGESHPFGPKRHDAFSEEFYRVGLNQQVTISHPHIGTQEQVELFHTSTYVESVKTKSNIGKGYLDAGDTPAILNIYDSALYVVGTVLDAADNIMTDGKCKHAFIPIAGLHHARRNCAAGFCVFNDCAILIEYLRKRYGLIRIAYVDIDAHHGDGVYYGFESDPNVYIVDFHEDASYLYPGTGTDEETGTGNARGSKLNINLPPGATDEDFLKHWPLALDFLEKAKPEFFILQCGADSIAGDPITHLAYSAKTHYRATKDLLMLAKRYCKGHLIACGGGGYNLDNIANTWTEVVRALVEPVE